nr:MAG TPA: hypothetical protein [Caudoviricetes sp.]
MGFPTLFFFFQLYIINIEDKSKLKLVESSLSKFIKRLGGR